MKERIAKRVHELYWEKDVNCATTSLLCLSELLEVELQPQVLQAAAGMHGAGGYRAQCGLVEGPLMFLGIYLHLLGKPKAEVVSACRRFAAEFEAAFGSLRCSRLRPTGFSENDPPHLCEGLTRRAIEFAYRFVLELSGIQTAIN